MRICPELMAQNFCIIWNLSWHWGTEGHQAKKHNNYPGIIFTIMLLVCFGVIIALYGLEKQTNQHNDRRTNKQRLIQIGIQIRGLYPVPGTRYPVAGSRINTITIDYKLH